MDQRPASNRAPLTDVELVERIGAGDRAAETELVQRFPRGVLNLILRDAPEYAEDIHQETFRAIVERLRTHGLLEPRQLKHFILRTAKKILLTARRNAARRPALAAPDFIEKFEDYAPGPFEQLSRNQLTKYVRQVIAELPVPRDRSILYSFYIEGIDKQQICAELNLDTLHFNRVLHRARERFRELVLSGNVHELEIKHESR